MCGAIQLHHGPTHHVASVSYPRDFYELVTLMEMDCSP